MYHKIFSYCRHIELKAESSSDFASLLLTSLPFIIYIYLGTEKFKGNMAQPISKFAQVIEAREEGPATPKYARMPERLNSYQTWPQNIPQQPECLTEAGFIYQGIEDRVQCFYCNGALKNWTSEDNPWVEHAKWFGECAFLRLKHGSQFVNMVQRQNEVDGQDVVVRANL